MARHLRPLYQTFVLTQAMKVAVDSLIEQPPTIYSTVVKATNARAQNVLLHIINYQHISITSAIISRAVLKEY
jgi:hypothetical protein